MKSTAQIVGSLMLAILFIGFPGLAQEQQPVSMERQTFGQAIQALTFEEVDQILLEVQSYQTQNPGASEDELDKLVMKLVIQQVRKPARPAYEGRNKSGYPLPEKVGALSTLEWSICVRSPLKCTKMYSCANKAKSTAPGYFSDGCTNGRCDAFRHTYWNALMVRRIDYSFAREFAAAHEAGIQSNIGTLPFQMDVFNNAWGQGIGKDYPASKYSETDVEGKVKSAVLTGKLVIIKNNRIVKSNQ
jgi:hypothetical protein